MLRTLCIYLLGAIFYLAPLVSNQGISLADDYKNNSGLQWEWAITSLKDFPFSLNDKVLDVGCGDGKITALIAKQIPNGIIIGLDISEKMVKQASSFFQAGNLIFLQGNASAIPFKQQFDKLVSFCTLHWVLNQEQALESMKECLKPGGIMLLVLPAKSPNNLATISEKIACSEKWISYFPIFKQERIYYTLKEYTALLEKADLTILSIKETKSVTNYKDLSALKAWIKPLINFIDHLSPELQELFIEDVATQMLQNDPPLSDGSIDINHVKIEVVAMKQ